MGSGSSALRQDYGGPAPAPAGLGDLPEGCAAAAMMNLEPIDICKLARVNRAFRGASSADFIWETKLPSNYRDLVDKVFDEMPQRACKKDMYERLMNQDSPTNLVV